MPVKPTDQEDEYFARLEFERRKKTLDERETQGAEDERLRILAVDGGRCPKCGAELVPVPYRGIELDKCSRCATSFATWRSAAGPPCRASTSSPKRPRTHSPPGGTRSTRPSR